MKEHIALLSIEEKVGDRGGGAGGGRGGTAAKTT